MSESARAVAPQEGTGPGVVGYVEAMTEKAALGWVWRPGLQERLTVELRLGAQTIAHAVADGMREDLARSGIGDGRHAFTLPIPDAVQSRASELRVFVLRDGGAAVALDAPPAPDTSADRVAQLQRGVDMLIGSQRLMHRNLQAALLQQTPSLATPLADIAAAQAELQESIATFELFAVRLEQARAPLARRRPERVQPRRGLAAVAGLSSLALVASCWALYRVMLGGSPCAQAVAYQKRGKRRATSSPRGSDGWWSRASWPWPRSRSPAISVRLPFLCSTCRYSTGSCRPGTSTPSARSPPGWRSACLPGRRWRCCAAPRWRSWPRGSSRGCRCR